MFQDQCDGGVTAEQEGRSGSSGYLNVQVQTAVIDFSV